MHITNSVKDIRGLYTHFYPLSFAQKYPENTKLLGKLIVNPKITTKTPHCNSQLSLSPQHSTERAIEICTKPGKDVVISRLWEGHRHVTLFSRVICSGKLERSWLKIWLRGIYIKSCNELDHRLYALLFLIQAYPDFYITLSCRVLVASAHLHIPGKPYTSGPRKKIDYPWVRFQCNRLGKNDCWS